MTKKDIMAWLENGGCLRSAQQVYDQLPARIQGKGRLPILATLRQIASEWKGDSDHDLAMSSPADDSEPGVRFAQRLENHADSISDHEGRLIRLAQRVGELERITLEE